MHGEQQQQVSEAPPLLPLLICWATAKTPTRFAVPARLLQTVGKKGKVPCSTTLRVTHEEAGGFVAEEGSRPVRRPRLVEFSSDPNLSIDPVSSV